MKNNQFDTKDFWRAILLYGRNAATYKIALAQSLIELTDEDKNIVTLDELAAKFFNLYKDRLKNKNMPQLYQKNRITVMERIIMNYETDNITETKAIENVARRAFNDVIPRFHTVYGSEIPIKFYEYNDGKLILTDNIHEIISNNDEKQIKSEVLSRWDLLEAAFEINNKNGKLINDIRKFYIKNGYERTDITHNIPVLNSYQNDTCFYCGEKMQEGQIEVDHVIPRQLVQHDQIWNLVLAHGFCNNQKLDALPSKEYIIKLINRNEHFIKSNHPIKNKLIKQLGETFYERKKYIQKVYEDAKIAIGFTWEGIKGYNPETDEFYKTFIRNYINQIGKY